MFKKLFLSAVIGLFAAGLSAQSVDQTVIVQQRLDHIAQEKKAIVFELKTALVLFQKGQVHFSQLFQDDYAAVKQVCLALLTIIVESDEFSATVEDVTDAQVRLIADELARYNDLIVDPSVFPLEQKLKDELAVAAFDPQTGELFNLLYVAISIARGSKMLLEKLDLKEQALIAQRDSIDPAHQAVAA